MIIVIEYLISHNIVIEYLISLKQVNRGSIRVMVFSGTTLSSTDKTDRHDITLPRYNSATI
jgi:hypothetical protein